LGRFPPPSITSSGRQGAAQRPHWRALIPGSNVSRRYTAPPPLPSPITSSITLRITEGELCFQMHLSAPSSRASCSSSGVKSMALKRIKDKSFHSDRRRTSAQRLELHENRLRESVNQRNSGRSRSPGAGWKGGLLELRPGGGFRLCKHRGHRLLAQRNHCSTGQT
jgi:hypothetical protein